VPSRSLTLHASPDTVRLQAAGAAIIFELFQDADYAIKLLSVASGTERTELEPVDAEGRETA
jgi:hypothetical protein